MTKKKKINIISTPHPPSPFFELIINQALQEAAFRWGPGHPVIPSLSEPFINLDKEYPHNCFNCDHEINSFNVFRHAKLKYPDVTVEIFEKWWKSKHVQFYCCKCHRSVEVIKMMIS